MGMTVDEKTLRASLREIAGSMQIYPSYREMVTALPHLAKEEKETLKDTLRRTSVSRWSSFRIMTGSQRIDSICEAFRNYKEEREFLDREDEFKDKAYGRYMDKQARQPKKYPVLMSRDEFVERVYDNPNTRLVMCGILSPTEYYNYEKYQGYLHKKQVLVFTSGETEHRYEISKALRDFDANYQGKDKAILASRIDRSVSLFKDERNAWEYLSSFTNTEPGRARKMPEGMTSEGARFLKRLADKYIHMERVRSLDRTFDYGSQKDDTSERERREAEEKRRREEQERQMRRRLQEEYRRTLEERRRKEEEEKRKKKEEWEKKHIEFPRFKPKPRKRTISPNTKVIEPYLGPER